jgi:hypothetical protein
MPKIPTPQSEEAKPLTYPAVLHLRRRRQRQRYGSGGGGLVFALSLPSILLICFSEPRDIEI